MSLLFHHLCQSPSWEPLVGKQVLGAEQEAPAMTVIALCSVIKPGCRTQTFSWGGPKADLPTPLHMATGALL